MTDRLIGEIVFDAQSRAPAYVGSQPDGVRLYAGDRAGPPMDRLIAGPFALDDGRIGAVFRDADEVVTNVVLEPTTPWDEEDGVQQITKAAIAGDVRAMVVLGAHHHNEGDDKAAVKWYRATSEAGHPKAMVNLADMLADGSAKEREPKELLHWLRRAAAGGEITAVHALADYYTHIDPDLKRAAQLYERAARGGFVFAMDEFANRLADGRGVEEDDEAAFDWFMRAAQQGFWGSMHNVGVCYATGEGVQQDRVRAVAWLELAAERGFAESAELAAVYREQLSPEEVAESQRHLEEMRQSVPEHAQPSPPNIR